MVKNKNIPKLRKDFIIVVHDAKAELAALVLSYLYDKDRYLPVFTYQNVDVSCNLEINVPDIYAIQRKRAEEFSVFLNNAIIENGGCENLIYLGLSEEQKSYLDVHNYYNTLDIEIAEDIPAYLGGFGFAKDEKLECSLAQIGIGLFTALNENRLLSFADHNPLLDDLNIECNGGLVIVERILTANFIVAVNYAASVNAKVYFTEALDKGEEEEVHFLLEGWQAGIASDIEKLKDKIGTRIGGINFSCYDYVTFFTEGLPYPLSVYECPSSLVNLIYRPDFFVFNAHLAEFKAQMGSAVVFSPILFKDEETEVLISLLEFENYYLRKMTGDRATTYNLKNTIENYPFGVMHICSHGGDVDGTDCLVRFMGSDNLRHCIEFSHVLNVAFTPYRDRHAVESIYYFKKLDGLLWRSHELKAKGYSHELYASLLGEISKAFDQKKVVQRGKIFKVPNSKSIKCAYDLNYMANFDQFVAPNGHPFIFNNTCWSWANVSVSFLVGGCRGYIGTLREIENNKAVRFAKIFYNHLFSTNIITAFHAATQDFLKENPEPIYVYWGLHFSTVKNNRPVEFNKAEILNQLGHSLAVLMRKLENNEGNVKLLEGKISDSIWLVGDVKGTTLGHFPKAKL